MYAPRMPPIKHAGLPTQRTRVYLSKPTSSSTDNCLLCVLRRTARPPMSSSLAHTRTLRDAHQSQHRSRCTRVNAPHSLAPLLMCFHTSPLYFPRRLSNPLLLPAIATSCCCCCCDPVLNLPVSLSPLAPIVSLSRAAALLPAHFFFLVSPES